LAVYFDKFGNGEK